MDFFFLAYWELRERKSLRTADTYYILCNTLVEWTGTMCAKPLNNCRALVFAMYRYALRVRICVCVITAESRR